MSRGTPAHGTNAGGSSQTTPMAAPHMTTTSPTPSPRRAHFPLAPSYPGPASPRLGSRIVPQRMPSDSSDREGSPGIDSPSSRRTTLVMGFSPGSTNSPLPSVAENGRAASPTPRPLITTMTSPLARRPSQFNTPVEQIFPPGLPFGSPGRSPRNLNPELPPRSRRNSAAPVSISIRSSDRSATPRGSRVGLPKSGRDSGHGTPGGTSQTVTPRGEGSSNGPGQRPVLVQMGSGPKRREDSWTPKYEHSDAEDWTFDGGMLLEGDDGQQERSWTSLDEEEEASKKNILKPGDVFGEGLLFQGDVITAAIGRMYGHDIDHPLRRGGSEIGMARRNGPVGVGPTAGRERQKRSYEVVRVAGEGSFAQVYYIRERSGNQREYALKIVARPNLSDDQYADQLFEATVHLSLPIHTNIVTLHETLQTKKWIFFLLEWCPGDDLFYWLENNKVRPHGSSGHQQQHSVSSTESNAPSNLLSSSKYSSSTIPFSPGAMFSGLAAQHPGASSLHSAMGSPFNTLSPASHAYGASPAASMIFSHNNQHSGQTQSTQLSQTPPTPSLLSAFSANTLLRSDRLRLIASMFSQMCEAVAVCHEAGISHRDIKPENFICCDSIDLETVAENEARAFGPAEGRRGDSAVQSKRKVIVKLTDFGLATTEQDCDDMQCGSKPYMSYECRNGHVAPSYRPAPSDVWSLGVVLLNMMFHRACWSEATDDNYKFGQYVRDRRGYLMNHFPGIGNQVATFLADHVLCLDVGDRVSARDFGKWIRNLPEMVAGRTAVREMKTAVKELRSGGDQGLFQKSPIVRQGSRKTKTSTSALTTTAPGMAPTSFQGLSSLPPPVSLAYGERSLPDLSHAAEPTKTSETQITPAEAADVASPEPSELNSPTEGQSNAQDDQASLVAAQQKKKKRGVRKGKAAQAANRPAIQPEQEALLSGLANGAQELARDLSKTHISRVDTASPEQFPPLGTSPAQITQSKRAKWREMLTFSSTADNPELAALARRVAERDAGGQGVKGGFGNWSAPAKMQDDHRGQLISRPGFKQTNTMSTSGVTSQLSSFGGTVAKSSATSSGIEEEPEEIMAKPQPPVLAPEIQRPDEGTAVETKEADENEDARARKVIEAATALSSFGTMGSFGQRPRNVPRHGPLSGRNMTKAAPPPSKPVVASPHGSKATAVPIAKSSAPTQAQTPGGRTITTPSLKSSATLTKTTVGSASSSTGSSVPLPSASLASNSTTRPLPHSQTADLQTASLSATPISNDAPSVPAERQGKLKGQMRFFDKLMRGVQSSNKKE